MMNRIKRRCCGPGGCVEILRVALPLIISTGAFTLQMFVDRVFLMWYEADAMSAAMQAGITAFTFASLFLGTVTYVNTFVAQYMGAGRRERVGPAVWQGIYFSVFAGILILPLIPLARPIFNMIGHDPSIRGYEITYFQIMCLGSGPMLIAAAISSFFTGRRKTKTVMYVRLAATALNIILDYCLIFGRLGFSEWGIAGAAWATVFSSVFSAVIFMILFLSGRNRRKYTTGAGCRLEKDLFGRLMRFGLPNGVQFLLDMLAFTFFISFVGRIDKVSLGATAIAFQINTLSFMPMIGLGIALTTLVGQSLGQNDPNLAQRTTWSACYLAFSYMVLMAIGFWFYPEFFMYPFSMNSPPEQYEQLRPFAENLLRFVAFYCLFDTGNIIFSAALKGAGDTRFVMVMSVVLHWAFLCVPAYLGFKLGWGLYAFWGFFTGFVCLLAIAFLLRFLQGKWKTMLVIEAVPPGVPPVVPSIPTTEVDSN